ncbi:MAG: long-chain fatty acid--CoA ligase [Planctomycetes bacterium]|nr:long-chain fatty acid--CoA ligase [Planctomycetota bacterium]
MLASECETLAQLFRLRVARTPDREAYREKRQGRWVPTTWRALGERVERVAAGLSERGLSRGDTVAILGPCRPEWTHVDAAALALGARTVGVYENLLDDQVRYLLEDSAARVLVVQGAAPMERLLPLVGRLPRLERMVVWDHEPRGDGRLESLEALARRGEEALGREPGRVERLAAAVRPEDVATVVYTSGTTGQPKGVPLGHGLLVGWLRATQDLLLECIGQEDITMSFLPLAHVAEHVAGLYGRINLGLATAYATSYETLLDEVQEVRPTFFGAVPRIFEKMYGRIRERVAQASRRRQAIFRRAEALARRRARAELGGEPLSLGDRLLLPLADRLVYRRIRAVFGGRVKTFITGSAPIELEILEFFQGVGMKVCEVYGLSESCAIAFANTSSGTRLGTVGRAIPGLQYRLAPDGEILIRGTGVFGGYLNLPEASAEAFDAEGYFHTGDVGEVDADGYLRITDRKKNLIKTAGGKYVVPARIEALVKEEPLVSQVYVHGDRRPYAVALITLDERETSRVAADLGVEPSALPTHPEVLRRIDSVIERANARLARFEQVKRHAVLPRDFSLEGGTLTVTMKIKRRAVAEKFAECIERLYADSP